MSPRNIYRVISIFLLSHISVIKCVDIQETLDNKLYQKLSDSKLLRQTRSIGENSIIWQEYEFRTGAGNREELIVTNITIYKDPLINVEELKWQVHEVNNSVVLGTSCNSTITLYQLNSEDKLLKEIQNKTLNGEIVAFTLLSISNAENDLIIVACMEAEGGISLEWYRLYENEMKHFWSWPIHIRVEKILYLQENYKNKLLLFKNNYYNSNKSSISPIYICEFTIDFTNDEKDYWQFSTKLAPVQLNIRFCPFREKTIVGVQAQNDTFLYNFINDQDRMLHEFQRLPSTKSKNFVCFESGHIQYIAISGPETALYILKDNEFQYDHGSDQFFNGIDDIYWIENLPMNTYRAESLLLMQMTNLSVVALTWKADGFQVTQLPSSVLNQFDLSKITVIPGFGFVSGNTLVKFDIKLRELPRPKLNQRENFLKKKILIEEVLRYYDSVLSETNSRIEHSYLKNSLVTGNWNVSTIIAKNVTVNYNNVNCDKFNVGSKNLIFDEANKEYVLSDEVSLQENLGYFQQKLDEIDKNIKQMFHHDEIIIATSIDKNGSFFIKNIMNVQNFKISYINDLPISDYQNFKYDKSAIISGQKSFPSLDIETLDIKTINGIPKEKFMFDSDNQNYSHINFSLIDHMMINGSLLNVDVINKIRWNDLQKNITWKNFKPGRTQFIYGDVIIDGEIEADYFIINYLNNVEYPNNYVFEKNSEPVSIMSEKSFNFLTVADLLEIETLNGIPINDFVNLRYDVKLNKSITFENASIDSYIKVNQNIENIPEDHIWPEKLLNETNIILNSDLIFTDLIVKGKILVEKNLDGTKWSDFDDILQRTDQNIEIKGNKTFLNHVKVSDINIKSNKINGYHIDEFLTTNTSQILPKLKTISANVTFNDISYDDVIMQELVDYINEELENSRPNNCLNKTIMFQQSPIIDNISFQTVNNKTGFYEKYNLIFSEGNISSFVTNTSYVKEIIVNDMNDLSLNNLTERFINVHNVQNLTGKYTIDYLDTDILNATFINGISIENLETLKEFMELYYRKILSGDIPMEKLIIKGKVKTLLLNDLSLQNISSTKPIETITFDKSISIKNLTVLKMLNGRNFTEFANDVVFNSDLNIFVRGHKTFNNINCEVLNTSYLNGHPIENILDPDKYQVLEGPITVNGSITVKNSFLSSGKINDILFNDFMDTFKYSGTNILELRGDCECGDNVTIKDLVTLDLIQGKNFLDFREEIVPKAQDNIVITGRKTFNNSVSFKQSVHIDDILNDLKLRSLYEKVIFIDKPFSVKSKVLFENDIAVENDITINKWLDAKTIKRVDLAELRNNVIYKNEPTYINAHMTFENAIFNSDLNIAYLNDIGMDKLIPLHTKQYLVVNTLKGTKIEVKNAETLGLINGYSLSDIRNNILNLTGQQNITGHFRFHNKVHSQHNFNARQINGISPKQLIDLDSNDTIITGKIEFEEPIILNGSLRAHRLNEIDLITWKNTAVTSNSFLSQIVHGNWKIYGNIYFEQDVTGNDLLNGTNVKSLSAIIERTSLEVENSIAEEKMDQTSACKDLIRLKEYAENQLYQFNTFEYMKILVFTENIISIHHFELNNLDYLIVNYHKCCLDVLLYTGEDFKQISSRTDFGTVYQWFTIHHKSNLYFLTVGKSSCGRNSGNLWEIKNNELIHIYDLGNITDARIMEDGVFLVLTDTELEMRSINDLSLRSHIFTFHASEGKRQYFVKNSDKILLANSNFIYEYDQVASNMSSWFNCFSSDNILSFKLGIYKREMFIYTGGEMNKDFIFISNRDMTKKAVYQTIMSHRPGSLTIMSFENDIETLVIYTENKKDIKIYEYKGLEGFKYRDAIKLNAEKLVSFEIRKHPSLTKKHCLALINKNKITILEAKMYGEKLILETPISCGN